MPSLLHRAHDRLHIEANVFTVLDPEVMEHPDADLPDFTHTGLLGFSLSGPAVVCCTHLGLVTVTAELWDSAPALELNDWDDVAEAAFAWRGTEMEVWGDGEDEIPLPIPGPGTYRIRVSGANRDGCEDRDEDDPQETFLLQVWPEATAAPAIALVKGDSEIGAYWRDPEALSAVGRRMQPLSADLWPQAVEHHLQVSVPHAGDGFSRRSRRVVDAR